MNDPRLIALSGKLNKYVALIRTENPNMSENDIVQRAAFHKKDHSTFTMPKDIDINTSEGDRKAGKFVDELRAAKKRGDKLQADASQQAWENRKVQVTVDGKD